MSLVTLLLVNLVHVAGHLAAGRLLRVTIDRVSLGIGPTLWRRSVGGTTLRLALVPLGVLVRLRRPPLRGESPDGDPAERPFTADGENPGDPRDDLHRKGPLVRLTMFCAAPGMVLLLAFAAAFYLNSLERPVLVRAVAVAGVMPGAAAEVAGVRRGDQVRRVNGEPIGDAQSLVEAVARSRGQRMVLDLTRDGSRAQVEVVPRHREQRWVIGVRLENVVTATERRSAPDWITRFPAAGASLGRQAVGALEKMGQMIRFFHRSTARSSTVGGPVRIVPHDKRVGGDPNYERYERALVFSQTIVFYLVLCLLPVPYLDGRRLLFLAVEVAARRTLHPRYEQWTNRVGLALFAALPLWTLLHDVLRFLG